MRDHHAARGTDGPETSKQSPVCSSALNRKTKLIAQSYGVSRVYDQQCGYVLSDAQAAQLKMRDLLKVTRNNDLDSSAAMARYVQLLSSRNLTDALQTRPAHAHGRSRFPP